MCRRRNQPYCRCLVNVRGTTLPGMRFPDKDVTSSDFLDTNTCSVKYTNQVNRLDDARRAQIVRCLCEGNSIRSTSRLCGCAINTVVKLLMDVGPACLEWHAKNVVGLSSRVVQVDEIWAFIGSKAKNTSDEKKAEGQGDVWTWTALDSDSKLMISWNVGDRSPAVCRDFMHDLASRLTRRIQLTSDGYGTYPDAVKLAFGKDVDYGMLVKHYGQDPEGEKRYSPAVCTGISRRPMIGEPMESEISTSYVERQNLNIRMGCRRYTRLTNAFSKKLENHEAAISLYFMFYNYCRPHQTLTNKLPSGKKVPTTPAMVSGLTDHQWTIEEMIAAVLG